MVKVRFYGHCDDENLVKKYQTQISDRFTNDYPDFQLVLIISEEQEEFSIIFELIEFESIEDIDTFLCEEISNEWEIWCEISNAVSKKSYYFDEADEWLYG